MKKLLYISFLALVAVFFIQCDSVDDLMTENALEGGLVDLSTSSVNYVIGSGATYTFDLFIHQEGDVKINKVNIYKSCFYQAAIPWSNPSDEAHTTVDSVSAKYTDEILEHSFDITETTKSHWVSTLDWGWEELRDGLTQEDGNELPTDEGGMEISNYFKFVIEVVLSDGRTVRQGTPVYMTISTRFAGTYQVTQGAYFRIGDGSGRENWWVGEEVVISSVDAITYKFEDWGILSGWEGYFLYFQIDPNTGAITYPETWDGVAQNLNDMPIISPVDRPDLLTNVIPMAGATMNTAIKDDVEGKDVLNMVHGYLTSGSADPVNDGSREFYFLMQKVVN